MLLSIIITVVLVWSALGAYIFSELIIECMSPKSVIFLIIVCGPIVWFCVFLVAAKGFVNGE